MKICFCQGNGTPEDMHADCLHRVDILQKLIPTLRNGNCSARATEISLMQHSMNMATCLPTTQTWNGIWVCHGTDLPDLCMWLAEVILAGEAAAANGPTILKTACQR